MPRGTRRVNWWFEFDDGYDLAVDKWIQEISLSSRYIVYGVSDRESCIVVVCWKHGLTEKQVKGLIADMHRPIMEYWLEADILHYRIAAVKRGGWFKEIGVMPLDRKELGKRVRERWDALKDAACRLDYDYIQNNEPKYLIKYRTLIDRLTQEAKRRKAMTLPPDYYEVNGERVEFIDNLRPGTFFTECKVVDGDVFRFANYKRTKKELKI